MGGNVLNTIAFARRALLKSTVQENDGYTACSYHQSGVFTARIHRQCPGPGENLPSGNSTPEFFRAPFRSCFPPLRQQFTPIIM